MSDGYGVDLTAMSLEALQQTLAEGDLLPSHRPLRENLAAHFEQLRAQGYASVQDVVEALRTKTTLARVSPAVAGWHRMVRVGCTQRTVSLY